MKATARLAEIFRQARQNLGLSLAEAAQLLEVDTDTLHSYEWNFTEIPLDMVFAMSNTFNVPPEDVAHLIIEVGLEVSTEKKAQSQRSS